MMSQLVRMSAFGRKQTFVNMHVYLWYANADSSELFDWCKPVALSTDGRLVHQATDSHRKYLQSPEVAPTQRRVRGATRSGGCLVALSADVHLRAGRYGYRGCRRIELEVTARKLLISAFILKENDLSVGLAPGLKPERHINQPAEAGNLAVEVHLTLAGGRTDAESAPGDLPPHSVGVSRIEIGRDRFDVSKLLDGPREVVDRLGHGGTRQRPQQSGNQSKP